MSPVDPRVLALLHTSPVHVATFDALAAEEAADLTLRHVVREDLLAVAREAGRDAVAAAVVAALAGIEADVVLCTCSTIGALAERAARPVSPCCGWIARWRPPPYVTGDRSWSWPRWRARGRRPWT